MDIRDVLRSLNSPSDWFVVLGAGVAGLVLDGAANIVPLPFFSPGICAATAAATALSIKRGLESAEQARRQAAAREFWVGQANQLIVHLTEQGESKAAADLSLEMGAATVSDEIALLESAVWQARARMRTQA